MNLKHPVLLSTTIVVIGLSSVLSLFSTQPVQADSRAAASAALIEPELESALKKHFEKRWFSLIAATDQQQIQLSKIIDKQTDNTRPVRQKVRQELLNLTDLLASETANDQEIKDKIEEIRKLRGKLIDLRVNTILEIRAQLTQDQRQTMANRAKGFLSGNPRLGLLR